MPVGVHNVRARGAAHSNWKGDSASYKAKHHWAARSFGRPSLCEKCGRTKAPNGDRRYFQWANVSGRYLRIRKDWMRLCAKCHGEMDRHIRRNSRLNSNNTSGEKNVSWYAVQKKWGVNVALKGKKVFLGLFRTKKSAVLARDEYRANV